MPTHAHRATPFPFALSLSKGRRSAARRAGQGFDRLSPNGLGVGA